MYGSSLMRVTLRPRDSRIAAREAEAIPLPREDTAPPVTKTNLVMSIGRLLSREVVKRDYKEGPTPARPQGHSARRGCCAATSVLQRQPPTHSVHLRLMNDLAGKHIV